MAKAPDIQEPYTLSDLQAALGEATGSAEFAADVFQKHIAGREPLDYARLLGAAGLELRKANPGKVWMGASHLEESNDGLKLADVSLRGSPLYEAGLEQGDEIRQCDGKAVRKNDDLQDCLKKHASGDMMTLAYVGRGGPKKAEVKLAEDPAVEVVTYEKAGRVVSEPVRAFRMAWLGSHAIRAKASSASVN